MHDVRAVVLTHGHEDHVGALPYLMREIEVPEVWATRLTLGLIKSKLDEHGLMRSAELVEIEPDKGAAQIGPYQVEFVRMAHSIPDAVALAFDTPGGPWSCTRATTRSTTRRSTGSAPTSASSRSSGNRGVDLLLGDSTNAERPGVTESERTVGRPSAT